MKFLTLVLLAAFLAPAQTKPVSSDEEQDLDRALSEAGSSAVEYARAIERHLEKYPNSPRRAEMERVLAQAAVDQRDKRRILRYGIPVIESGSRNRSALEHVTRSLLDTEGKENHERALRYSKLLQEVIQADIRSLKESADGAPGRGRRLNDLEEALSRAFLFEGRALGSLERPVDAAQAASTGWDTAPSDEAAHERARWLEKAGRIDQAASAMADAIMISEREPGDAYRIRDRRKLGELVKQSKGSETGLGDMLLAAFDRTSALLAARRERLIAFDPNTFARQPSDFVISSLKGEKLHISSLKGKVVVIDFWATWCGPCRAQHPLYEEVKQKFKDNADLVFLGVSTDEERDAVEPFLAAHKWSKQIYFDDGMAAVLRINSIPTTVILGRDGSVSARMNGFIPDRFVTMLSERIADALQEN